MNSYVVGLSEINESQISLAGGKGVNLGVLSRINGVPVPTGFCVTTSAFDAALEDATAVAQLVDTLSASETTDRDTIRSLSASIRSAIERVRVPADVVTEIIQTLAKFGDSIAYAVRSSATAEDLPGASFAGQQDTYLNVIGAAAVITRIQQCWASLYTERAVAYRMHNRIDHRKVSMAVVVQHMVFPSASGILFTADPLNGNRKVTSIDASFGLGEALVSGVVSPDVYKVREGRIVSKLIGSKQIAFVPSPLGGTQQEATSALEQRQAALSEHQILRLDALGRRIEAHFGTPQDIEWCLVDDDFHVVQSRPITTLFPVPVVSDNENHVWMSVAHQQMMTDAFKPLGLSVWQLTTPRPMGEAGGRLFVDVTQELASSTTRPAFLGMLAKADPLFRNALDIVLERHDFVPLRTDDTTVRPIAGMTPAQDAIETDAAIPLELIARNQASIAALATDIRTKSGESLFDFIVSDLAERSRVTFAPRSMQVIMAAMESAAWLNEHMKLWLNETNAADVLTQSVPNNVTSEMGLALLDVADAIRPHAEVVSFLRAAAGDDFLQHLPDHAGGIQVQRAIVAWLDKYGMRGVGEIDITRDRWSEKPSMLLPILLGHVDHFAAGESGRRFERGLCAAAEKERDLLARLRALPNGNEKADETKRMIDRVRTFSGYREYPKFGLVSRYFEYKKALLAEAERLVAAGVLLERDDAFYLRFDELQSAVRTQHVDYDLIRERKASYQSYCSLTPPRVLTSEGEGISPVFRRDHLPETALLGLAVSAGIIEGRARVILEMDKAKLEPGDILVTAFTDPSWTPLFLGISGLVTEVGGLMTHGAVIAREYGLPAIVGVEKATQRIKDGQRIRVNGTEGYIELLA